MTPRELIENIQSRRAMYDPSKAVRHEPVILLTEAERNFLCSLARRRPALPEQPLADDWLRSKIHKALNTYRFQHTVDEDGDSTLRMYDLLTPPGDSNVTRGKDEVFLLADYIASDLDAQHDEDRALLREAWHQLADARLSAKLYGEELERVKDEVHLRVLQNEEEQDRWKETEDRIRKHLGGDSDEA